MDKKLTAAVIGLAHVHVGTLFKGLLARPEVEFIGWCDTPATDKQDLAGKFRAPAGDVPYYENWLDLAAKKPDVAIVCCDNKQTREIAVSLLEAGTAVVLEKPMTIDYADAVAVYEAAKKSGAKLAVNWPIAWFPSFNKAKALCDAGEIGRIMRVTYRSPATWGPFSYSKDGILPPDEELDKTWWYHADRGGGSILDYACYGAALATWFFGKRAVKVKGVAHNFCVPAFDVEDYSAMLLDFGDGVGLLEGSWSTYNPGEIPSGPVIYGTEGTIVCDRHSTQVKIYKGRSHGPIPPAEVIECGNTSPELNFGENIVKHLLEDAPLHPLLAPELNVDVMFALDAGRADAGEPPVANGANIVSC